MSADSGTTAPGRTCKPQRRRWLTGCEAATIAAAAQPDRAGGRHEWHGGRSDRYRVAGAPSWSSAALGIGQKHLAAAYHKGGQGAEPGLQGCPLVRREQAYTSRCWHIQESTTCPKTSNESSPQQAAGYQPPKPVTLKTAPSGRLDDGASYTSFRCLAA
jgi:hypothetical protein